MIQIMRGGDGCRINFDEPFTGIVGKDDREIGFGSGGKTDVSNAPTATPQTTGLRSPSQ
jgi:hypothetical protein